MDWKPPSEVFPSIGTTENPAFFFDGYDLLLCYDIAPIDDGGIAVLQFDRVILFEKNSNNIEGLGASSYPIRPWEFTEVYGSERTERWSPLSARFWTISFNDVSVEVVFETVDKVYETRKVTSPHLALLGFLRTDYQPDMTGR